MAGSRTLKLSILADVDNLKKNLDTGANEVEGFGGKLEKFGKVAAAAFAAAAAAAAAYAGKLAIEGVKAAIEDEAAQKRLASALENVTGATEAQIKAVEEQILKTSLATGVADDKLRPALQRLATATGSVTQSQDLLKLALDISAATGKDVETVANALAKAYEGNTGALSRLGVGLSTAELKSLGFEGAVKELGNTFGGAALTQANTFEGQIQRLKVGFDEAKESVGAALLPTLKTLLDYFTNTLIPKLIEAKNQAIDPIKKAFADNEDTIRDLWKFIKDYLVPIFEFTLVQTLKNAGTAIAGIINIVSSVFNGIRKVIDDAIDGINLFIKAYNSIPILPDINLITKPTWVTGSSGANLGSRPLGNATTSTATSATTANITTVTTPAITTNGAATTPSITTTIIPSGNAIPSGFNPSAVRAGEEKGNVIINVNAPSIIDRENFSRVVVEALNESNARNGGGGGAIMGSQLVL